MSKRPSEKQALTDANRHLRELEFLVPELANAAAELEASGPGTMSEAEIERLLSKHTTSEPHYEQLKERMRYVKGSNPAVPDMIKRFREADAALIAARDALTVALEQKRPGGSDSDASAGGSDEYPDLAADIEQVDGMAMMLGDTQMFHNKVEGAALVCGQLAKMQKFCSDMKSKYADFLAAGGGGQLGNRLRFYEERLKSFTQAMDEFQASAPGLIKNHLDMATSLADESVEHKRAGAFGENGVVQSYIHNATSLLTVLQAIDPKASDYLAGQKRCKKLQKAVEKMKDSLRDDIIKSNRKPADNYRADDRDAILTAAKEAWETQYPKDRIVGMMIPSASWQRTTEWRWYRTSWHLYDYSTLKVMLGIEIDRTYIAKHFIDVMRHHRENDRLNYVVEDKSRAGVESLMLTKNW